MTTLLFVHGTGVREDDYNLTYATVQRKVLRHLPGMRVEPCLWGKEVGATLRGDGRSIPTYDKARAAPGGGQSESVRRDNVRWSLLYDDPLYELRSLAAMGRDPKDKGGPIAPGAQLTAAALRATLAAVTFSAAVDASLREAGHPAELAADAAAALTQDRVVDGALAAPGLADPIMRRLPLARAFVAMWAVLARRRDLSTLPGELRDAMYADVVQALGGAPAGIVDRVIGTLAGLLAPAGTRYVRRERTAVSDKSYPAAADILRYQARGGPEMRDFIAKRIRDIDDTVVVLAHSLGGIAAVELLASEDAPPVQALVTAGSQAPLLYELDALATLKHGEPLRKGFPRWLNLYDLNDALSYVGESVFPGKVKDVPVESRQPFPESHSAYWANDEVWQAMKTFLAQ